MSVKDTSEEAAGRDTKERIIRIAADLFAANGYHATGMEELSVAVKLGRGALYYHITGKEDLLFEIMREPVGEMVEFAEELQRGELPAEEKLRTLTRRLMRSIATRLPEWTVFFREVIALTGSRRKVVIDLRDRFEAICAAILDEGRSAGTLRVADPLLVKGILGMHNYSYLWLRPRGRLAPEEIADLFCDALFTGISIHRSTGQPRGQGV